MMDNGVRARGSWFRLPDGQRFYDFSSGISGGPLGYSHPAWRAWFRTRVPHLQAPSCLGQVSRRSVDFARRFFKNVGFAETPHLLELSRAPSQIPMVDELDIHTGTAQVDPSSILIIQSGLDSMAQLPEEAREFRHFLFRPVWMPEGFLPSLFISRDADHPLSRLPDAASFLSHGHPLSGAHFEVATILQRPARQANAVKISALLKNWGETGFVGRALTVRAHAAFFPTESLGSLAQRRHDFPGRVFVGRLSFLEKRGMALVFPPLEENPEHLGHRLSELTKRLAGSH